MKSIKDILQKKKFDKHKNVSREYQSYGVWLSEKLNDAKHKALYIKLARDLPRPALVKAYSFAIDYPEAKSKARIFMWKLKEQGHIGKKGEAEKGQS